MVCAAPVLGPVSLDTVRDVIMVIAAVGMEGGSEFTFSVGDCRGCFKL